MSTTVQLALANTEVNRLFTRKMPNNLLFYEALLRKVSLLSQRAYAQHVYALQALQRIHEDVHALMNRFDDELDRFEGLLEKKKQTRGKVFSFEARFHPVVSFSNSISVDLVALCEMYDKLLSTIKLMRTAGCFANDDDYFDNVRLGFKSVNQLFSQIILIPVKTLPTTTFLDVIDDAPDYVSQKDTFGVIDCAWLYQAVNSNLAPRLHETVRKPLLLRLKKKLEQTA